MDGQAIITVSAAVVALTQIIKWSPLPTDGYVPVVIVFALSGLGVMIWGASNEINFGRQLLWSYFAGWIAVSTSAAGVFGLAQATSKAAGGGERRGETL